jgi:hypothetical protein
MSSKVNTRILDDYGIDCTVNDQGDVILGQDELGDLLSIFEGVLEDCGQLEAAHGIPIEGIDSMRHV